MVNARFGRECKQVFMPTSCDVVCLTMMPGCRIGTEGAMALVPSIQRLDQLVQLHLHGGYCTLSANAALWVVIARNIMELIEWFWGACLWRLLCRE